MLDFPLWSGVSDLFFLSCFLNPYGASGWLEGGQVFTYGHGWQHSELSLITSPLFWQPFQRGTSAVDVWVEKREGGKKEIPSRHVLFFFSPQAVNSFMVTEELAARAPHRDRWTFWCSFTTDRQLTIVRRTKGNPPPSPPRCVKPNKGSAQTSSEPKVAAFLIFLSFLTTPSPKPPSSPWLPRACVNKNKRWKRPLPVGEGG